ncbi:MAG: hypothetical protein H0U73_10950 [Tatlockia sp.]|nr:hypothetical protein [Tatlockia sp.]
MRKYNEIEAELQQWKRELVSLKEKSEAKKKLISIIDGRGSPEVRSSKFKKAKNELLKPAEEESWSFWSFLWSLICCFWPSPPPISDTENLKILLKEGITIKTPRRLRLPEGSSGNSSPNDLLEEADYELALFIEPQKALADIQHRIESLPQRSDKPTDASDKSLDVSDEQLTNIMERLDAIKNRLNPGTYQNLLTQLYKKYPIDTLIYHYQRYVKAEEAEVSQPEEFIEMELMSRALIDLFILDIKTDPLSMRCYAIQELLLLLAFPKNSALGTLIGWAKHIKPQAHHLFECYEMIKPEILKAWSVPKIREITSDNEKIPQNTATILIQGGHHLFNNPLLANFARVASQELLINFYQSKESNEVFQQTKELLSEILGTWDWAKNKMDLIQCRELLKQTPTLKGFDYSPAIIHANALVIASMFREEIVLEKAQQEVFENLSLPLKPHELTWILSVVERIKPNGKELVDKVKTILTQPIPEKTKEVITNKQQTNNESTTSNRNRFSGKPGKEYVTPENFNTHLRQDRVGL